MPLNLGRMLGMGILSNIFGGNENQGLLQQNQQQPTQVANSGQNQGFFPNMNNMSPGQWANTAIALNSMRLEPDANLATAMREKIASDDKRMRGIETAQWLDANGRGDLKEMVLAGILDPQKALQIAMTKEDIPEWRQKLTYALKAIEGGDSLSDIENAILGIPQKSTPEFKQRLDLILNPPIDPKTSLPRVWTEDQLEVLGISKDSQKTFEAQIDAIDVLVEAYPEKWSDDEILDKKMSILDGSTVQTTIDIDLQAENSYAQAANSGLYKKHEIIIDGMPKLMIQIRRLHAMQDILDRADEGEIRTGVFEPLMSMVSRIAAGLGLGSGDQASAMQLLQSFMGGDTFPLIGALGIGARGMDTPEERKFLQASFVGEVTMQIDVLQAITQRRLDIVMEALEIYNQRASILTEDGKNSAYFKLYENTFSVRIRPIDAPIRQTKAVIDQLEEDKNETMNRYLGVN